jgi:predicted nucleic acid-binding protein
MRNAVLLDTSFLITLADPRRARHAVAKQYFQHFLSSHMPMVVSSIVVAEFCVRQELSTLPLEQLILLPFTHEDAEVAASFDFKALKGVEKDRQSLKDDLKIIGHAHARKLGYVITDDAETMFEYCEALRKEGRTHLCGIKLQTGFSLEYFTPDGQKDFPVVMEELGEYQVEQTPDRPEQAIH